MTQLKMPEPVAIVACSLMDISIGWNQAVPHNTKLYTTKALRDVLEQAAQLCELNQFFAVGDLHANAIREMKEQIK